MCKNTLVNTQLVVWMIRALCFKLQVFWFDQDVLITDLQRPFPRTVQGSSQSRGKPWERPTHIQWGKVQAILHPKGLGYHFTNSSNSLTPHTLRIACWVQKRLSFQGISCAFSFMVCGRTGVCIRKQSHLTHRKEELASPSQLRKSWRRIWTWVFGFAVWCSLSAEPEHVKWLI